MPNYRLVFAKPGRAKAAASVDFTARDAGEALILAQRHEGPAELWEGEAHLCTLQRSGKSGQFWIISGNEAPPAREG